MSARLSILAVAIAMASMLTACGDGGPDSFSAEEPTLAPPSAPLPTVTVIAPATATAGSAFNIEWSATNASSCAADFTDSTATSGVSAETETELGEKIYSVTCTGAGGSATGSASVQIGAASPEGLWQGSTGDGRAISGVVTREGDYWLVYSLSGGGSDPVGFYAGNAASTPSSALVGTFLSSNLRQVDFDSGAVSGGLIGSANYTAKTSLAGTLDPAGSTPTQFTVSGSFIANATIFNSPLAVPLTINSGTYDSLAGTGSWNVTSDLSGMGMGSINWNQTFTLDGATGVGYLNQATGCTGNNIACGGIGPEFYGPINAGGPIVAGVQSWLVSLPNFGTPTFAPTLTGVLTGLPSITADTFSVGTYNPAYETSPSVAAVAGSYNTGWTGIDTALNNAVVLSIEEDGSLQGSDAASGCTYTGGAGALAVHASGGNVYDVAVTFSGGSCVYDGQIFTGVATYDTDARQLMLAALNAARDAGFMVVAVKP